MPKAVGVAFKKVARSYWFDPGALDLKDMDRVVVETSRGLEIGTVRVTERDVAEQDLQAPLKRVIRLAGPPDHEQEQKNKDLAKKAMSCCSECVKKLNQPMKVVQAEYSFDTSQ